MKVSKNISVRDESYEIKVKKLRKAKNGKAVKKSLIYDPDEEIIELSGEEAAEDLSYYNELRESMSNW